jgi:hypothetical protein
VNVSRTQAQLAFAFFQKKRIGKLLLQAPHNIGRAIGRAIVYYKYMKRFRQRKHGLNDRFDIIAFVVSGYDNDLLQLQNALQLQNTETLLQRNNCPVHGCCLILF